MDDYIEYNSAIDNLYGGGVAYSAVSQLMAHNSFSSVEDGFLHHPQQYLDVKHQFKYGVRGFMIDVYDNPNPSSNHALLLHNQNLQYLQGISTSLTKTFYFEDYLEDIHYLLEQHNKSVITLVIENSKTVDSNKIKLALDSTGVSKYLLQKDPNDPSVTFNYMRNSGQRLVVFLENGVKTSTNNIYTTHYYKETTYSLEKDSLCIDRQEDRASFSNKTVNVFILNHFYSASCNPELTVTNLINIVKNKCSEVNDYNAIMKRYNLCKNTNNTPTFLSVDFVEYGKYSGPLGVIQYVNNSTNSNATSISTPLHSGSWNFDIVWWSHLAAGGLIGAGIYSVLRFIYAKLHRVNDGKLKQE